MSTKEANLVYCVIKSWKVVSSRYAYGQYDACCQA